MSRPKGIYVDSFDMYVTVMVLGSEKKKYGYDDAMGMAIETDDGAFCLVLPIKWDEGTVWHEAHHMARFINAFHGIITTSDDHEADAYLQEYIVRQLKQHIYKRK